MNEIGGILIVDDNPANLRLMSSVLREAGYAVRVAPGGPQALESVRSRLPDLILLDIRMPDMDGFEVCERLKAERESRDVPVIFLSALQDSADKLRGFAVGAVDYITKPFVSEEVLVRVQTHLALHTLQRALEDRVEERTRALRTLSAGNQAVVHADTVEEILERMERAITDVGGYAGAVVELDDGTVRRMGSEASCWPESIRPDAVCVQLDGCARRILNLPLVGHGGPMGCLMVLAEPGAPGAFSDPGNVALLGEMAGDLAYGIDTLRARAQNIAARRALEQSLEKTIEAIAATLEVRDPYTAGHQKRTTRIAVAIGREMGLDEDRLKGLYVAGTIHDIGKIAVPVEILSRPGTLSEAEFAIIRIHPVAGYDIIKGIEFPWPVANIVRQHHERLDGSGYPDGLKGDAILLESRILSVADVVEAISSHRPYRAALGLEVAIDELRRYRGIRFDPQVVDTCLKLIDEDRLPLQDA